MAGASIVAISVDPPDKSGALQRQLRLPFPILCDTERQVIQEWDIFNPRERGGIAKPAVFVIGGDRVLRHSSVDEVTKRVPASQVVRLLNTTSGTQPLRRKVYIPHLSDFVGALRTKAHG